MADKWTVKCGVCGIIGPALAPNLPPTTGCLHDQDVGSAGRCHAATILILEHALRRAVAPDCFGPVGEVMPGKLSYVLQRGTAAFVASRRALSGEADHG